MLNRHVLVTGAHRSGTTWVGRTLAHHPSIVYATYPHWLFLRHEDLARSPLTGFQQIFAYVGLRMTAKLRTIIETSTSAANPVETNSPAYLPRNARGSLETWRTRLTAAEIDRVIHATRDIAGRFYQLQGQEFV